MASPSPGGDTQAASIQESTLALQEKGLSSPVRPESVAVFLELDVNVVANLGEVVLQRIALKARQFEALKSQKMLDDVTYENSLHQTNSKIAILQQQLNEGCNEAETLRSRIKSIEDEKKALEMEFSDAQGRAGSSDGILKSLQQRVDALILEKRQTVELLDKRNQEIRELRSDMENAHNKNLDHRRTIVEMESHLQELRSAKLSAKLKEQSLSQEVEMLKKNNEWLDNELRSKSEEFKKFRTERLSKFSSVQNDLDRVQAEHSALSKSYEALKERFSDTSMKYEQSLAKVRDLQGAQDVAEESFRKEMASQQRLAELWERSAKDAKKRVEEVEELLSAERSKKAGDTAKWRAEAEKEHARAESLQKQLSGVESELQSLYQADKPANKAGFTTPQRGRDLGSPTAGAAVFSPSARIISELQKQGGNLVDLYAEFHDTKIRLERERHKNETLRAEMDAILEEMENHAPLILADREEKKRLELELAEMSVELEQSNKQAEEASAKLKTAEMKAKDSKKENSLLSTQIKDLSRQVQYLLIQNQMLIDSEPALDASEHAALQRLLDGEEVDDRQENSENDTQRLISQRLVLFKDIIELQKQNGDLLKITRELGSRMEREEEELKRKVENIESTAVEEAKGAIHKLQQDVKRLQVNSEALKRERDMFRRMLKNGENLETGTKEPNGQDHDLYREQLLKQNEDLSITLKEVQASFDSFKTESMTTISSLNKQVTELSDIRGTLQVKLSRAQSQEEYMQERYDNLQKDLALLRREGDQLRNRADDLQNLLLKHEARNEKLSEELIEAKSQAESLRSDVSNLKAEKQLWHTVEERLSRENKDLLQEKGRLNGVIANYQLLDAERDSQSHEAVRRLRTQIESLESELKITGDKLTAAETELKRVSARKETDVTDFRDKIEHLRSELSTTRDLYAEARSRAESLEAKVSEQQVMISSLNEKLSIYRNESTGNASGKQIEEDLATVRASLELTKNELALTQKHKDELSDIARTAEEALEKLTSAHDEYEVSMQGKLAEKDAELNRLQTELQDTRTLLDAAKNEMSTSKEEEADVVKSLQEENSKLEATVASLKENEAHLLQVQQQLRDELNNNGKLSREAQDNYEKELVKHAEAARSAQMLRDEVTALKDKVAELTRKDERSRELISSSQASWDSQKYTYEYEIEQLKVRLEDVSTQNRVLLDQVEALSKRRTTTNVDISGDAGEVESSSGNQLREIITFVRREKEIVECNLEVAQQENKRMEQRLRHVTEELDQARLELAKDNGREQELARIADDHKKVLQQLDNVNVLRESNASLRSQSQHYQKKASELEQDCENLRAKIEPLEEQLRLSVAEAEAKDGEIKLLKDDNERWRTRSSEIMQKYQRIDPEELKRIQEEAASVRQQCSSLQTELDNSKEAILKLQSERDDIVTKLNKEIEKSKEALQEKSKLNEEVSKLRKEISSYDTKMANFRDKANVKVRELSERVRDLSAKVQAAEDNDQKTQAASPDDAERLKVLQEQCNEKTQRISTLEDEVNKLSDEILELKGKLATAAASAGETNTASNEAEFVAEKQRLEAKISDLNQEITSLKEAGISSANESAPAGTISLEEHQNKLQELQEKLDHLSAQSTDQTPDLEQLKAEARSAVEIELKEKIESELRSSIEKEHFQRSVALKKRYDEQLAAAKASNTGGDSEAMKAQIEAIKAQHKEEVEKLKAKFTEEKNKAIAGVRKEVEMRQKLLKQRITRLEEEKKNAAGGPDSTTQGVTGAASSGSANSGSLSIKGAAPPSRLPRSATARPVVLKPGAESGGKRQLPDGSGGAQAASKKRKENN